MTIDRYLVIADNGAGRLLDISTREASADSFDEILADFERSSESAGVIERLYPECVAAGVPYAWGLAGPSGAWYVLYPTPDHSPRQVAQARAYIRNSFDVARLQVRRIKRFV